MTAPGPQRRPNLFVLGAMKCGTTSFHSYLDAHPDIFMSDPKEPCHFVPPAVLKQLWPEMWARRYWETDRYLALFEGAGAARYLGESSTDYAKWPMVEGVPERIAAFAPEARFFYLVRDPVERAISHYWHNVKHGHEKRPMDEAITATSEYVVVGDYAMQIGRFAAVFGQDRILVLRSDALSRDAGSVMDRAFAWLGLAPEAAAPAAMEQKVHVTAETIGTDPAAASPLYRLLRSEQLKPLTRIVPQPLKDGLRIRLGGAVRRRDVDDGVVRARLGELVAPQIEALEAMLGETFPDWGRRL